MAVKPVAIAGRRVERHIARIRCFRFPGSEESTSPHLEFFIRKADTIGSLIILIRLNHIVFGHVTRIISRCNGRKVSPCILRRHMIAIGTRVVDGFLHIRNRSQHQAGFLILQTASPQLIGCFPRHGTFRAALCRMRRKNPVIRGIRTVTAIGDGFILIITQNEHQRILHRISKLNFHGIQVKSLREHTVRYLVGILQNPVSASIVHRHNVRIIRSCHYPCRRKRVFTAELEIYAIRFHSLFRHFRSLSAGRTQISVHHLKLPLGDIGIGGKSVARTCFVCLHLNAVSVECRRSPYMPAPKSGNSVFGGNHRISFGGSAHFEHDIAVSGIPHIVQGGNRPPFAGFPHEGGIGRLNLVVGRYHRTRIGNLRRSFRTVATHGSLKAIPFIGIGSPDHIAIGSPGSGCAQIPAHQHTAVVHVRTFNSGVHRVFRVARHIKIGCIVACAQIDGVRHITGATALRLIASFYQNIGGRSRHISLIAVFPVRQRIASRLVFRNIPGDSLGIVARIGCKLLRSRSGCRRLYIIKFLRHVHQLHGSHRKSVTGIRSCQVQTDFGYRTGQRDGKGCIVRFRVKVGLATAHRQVLSRSLARGHFRRKLLEVGQSAPIRHLLRQVAHVCQHIHRTRAHPRGQ